MESLGKAFCPDCHFLLNKFGRKTFCTCCGYERGVKYNLATRSRVVRAAKYFGVKLTSEATHIPQGTIRRWYKDKRNF